MTAKKTDYIIIYTCLCTSILGFAALVRLFVVTELKMDEFSSLVVFIITCLLLGGIYFSFQSILNDCLLPLVERVLIVERVLKPKEMVILEPAIITQEQKDIKKSVDESITQSTDLSVSYENYKTAAQQKIEVEQSRTLENVLHYTQQELSLYMEEAGIKQLSSITQFLFILILGFFRHFSYCNDIVCLPLLTVMCIERYLALNINFPLQVVNLGSLPFQATISMPVCKIGVLLPQSYGP